MNIATAFLMLAQRFVRELLDYFEYFATLFTLILINRHCTLYFLEILVIRVNTLFHNWVLLVVRHSAVHLIRKLGDSGLPRNEVDRLL